MLDGSCGFLFSCFAIDTNIRLHSCSIGCKQKLSSYEENGAIFLSCRFDYKFKQINISYKKVKAGKGLPENRAGCLHVR